MKAVPFSMKILSGMVLLYTCVIFCHSLKYRFKQYACGVVRYYLCRGQHLYIILFEQCFVVRRIISVAGEAVEFPNDDYIKKAFSAVLNHALEVGVVVTSRRKGAVDIIS